jgi:histone H3/H4
MTIEKKALSSRDEGASGRGRAPMVIVDVRPDRKVAAKRKPEQLCIPRLAFRRLVQEISEGFRSDVRFQREATDALQEAAERELVGNFAKCSRLASLCRKDTVREEHWQFVQDAAGDGGCTLLG